MELLKKWIPELKPPILEIGSNTVPSGWASPKLLFTGEYIGMDLEAGSGVDIVGNVTQQIPFPNNHFNTVLILETIEHVDKFWEMMKQVNRILAPNGVIIITTHKDFLIHNHPNDYWRFTTEGLKVVLEGYTILECCYNQGFQNVYAIARKNL